MKKYFIRGCRIILCLLLCAFLMASCGANEQYKNDFNSELSKDISDSTQENSDVSDLAGNSNTEPQKIIRNAELSIEAKDVEEAYDTLLKNAVALGGFEFEREMTKSGDYNVINAVIKVPSDKLADFTAKAKDTGNVINNILRSEDITDEYYDVQTRLTTMEKTLEKYYEFLEKADNTTDQLRITSQISELTSEIETLKGRITRWDSQVNYSSVDIYLRQYDDPISIKKEIQWDSLTLDDMWYLIKSGFTSVASAVVTLLQWIFIVFISGAIFFIPAIAVGIYLIIRYRRKIKNSKKQ